MFFIIFTDLKFRGALFSGKSVILEKGCNFMYKKLAIFLGALLIAALGSVITAYIFSGRSKKHSCYDDELLFI